MLVIVGVNVVSGVVVEWCWCILGGVLGAAVSVARCVFYVFHQELRPGRGWGGG